jgi:opacity protein-like surface antigen
MTLTRRLSKNGLCLSALAIFVFCFVGATRGSGKEYAPSSRGLQLSLKLSGGAGFLLNGGGDLERFRSGRAQFVSDYRQIPGYSSTFDWKRLSFLPDFNAEIILNIGSNFGIGIGIGIINATFKGNYSFQGSTTQNPWWGTSTETETDKSAQNYKIRAIPITLNLYFSEPLDYSQKFNLYSSVGVGYYFAKLTHDFKDDYSYHYEDNSWYYYNEKENYQFNSTAKETSKQNRVGFKAGLGLEMNLTSLISVGFEVFGRFVNFSNWTGDYSDSWTTHDQLWEEQRGWYFDKTSSGSSSEHGNLFMYDVKDNKLAKNYPAIWIWRSTPEGIAISNVKKAAINLNTVGALISLRLRFGL